MDKSKIVNLLCDINNEITADLGDNLEEHCRCQCQKADELLPQWEDNLRAKLPSLLNQYDAPATHEWKYICVNFHLLQQLDDALSSSSSQHSHEVVLSVQETKRVRAALESFVKVAFAKNLQPTLPLSRENRNDTTRILYGYNLLKFSTGGLVHCLRRPELRMLVMPQLPVILVALFQLGYAPLRKPTGSSISDKTGDFVMTEGVYAKLKLDQTVFVQVLKDLERAIHPLIFVRDLMTLFHSKAPMWFQKSLSATLTSIMTSKKGVEHIALAMLDGTSEDDTTKTWQVLEVLVKLIQSARTLPDFDKVQDSLFGALKSPSSTIFEQLIITCTRAFYLSDKDEVFLERIMGPLLDFTDKERQFGEEVVTDDLWRSVRLVYGVFVRDIVNCAPCLPISLLGGVMNVIFYFYQRTTTCMPSANAEMRQILVKYLSSCHASRLPQLFHDFLFFDRAVSPTDNTDVLPMPMRDDLTIQIDNATVIVKHSPHKVIHANCAESADALLDLLAGQTALKVQLFGYLLQWITTDKRRLRPPTTTSADLLDLEEQGPRINPTFERLLAAHHLLCELSQDAEVHKSLRQCPDDIIRYIGDALSGSKEIADDDSHFVMLMILDNLVNVDGPPRDVLVKYETLVEPLREISRRTDGGDEIRDYCNKILAGINEEKRERVGEEVREVGELDKALRDVCDPLLPVRGHGLLALARMVEKKDREAMERKQYLLNLFQLHLKDQDSYIYLASVQGLAALADIFTDTVLETLCEEYSDFARSKDPSGDIEEDDNGKKTRMKLGEVLVRVTKLLGEMAPKYKALLLNTFLSGTRDDDHLIRASSLSNLGEICRVLGYKLGTIVTEVLVCVHAIIATDKSLEARRGAVTVTRQLFAGLESETVSFLKDDILPIYRTLKEIYNNDKDDVMRLQAQLALEELNENMRNFVFPKPRLNLEKKIVMLD